MSAESPVVGVVIVHCHYERGGVTQVVQNHVTCLPQATQVVLFSGNRVSGLRADLDERVTSVKIPELDYDSLRDGTTDDSSTEISVERRADRLAARMQSELIASGLTPQASVIHWHNHSLGKNAAAPLAIRILADSGWRLLLQIHDFAEDQRPVNYLHLIDEHHAVETSGHARPTLDRILYPIHERISYAVLTAGDAEALVQSGIQPQRVHLIPNSVSLPEPQIDRDAAMRKISRAFGIDETARWLLYPVRGIRRKNVGEFLLWCQLLHRRSVALPENATMRHYIGGLTLRPATPVEAASYDRWNGVAKRLVPNVVFDAGQHPDISFVDNLAACHCVLSTSVAEGFGMAFLEPWLVDRRVVARDLPAVTEGFKQEGLQPDGLYQAAWIPGDRDWVRHANDRWRNEFDLAWAKIPASLRPTVSQSQTIDSDTDRIDFARLTPDQQISVMERIDADDDFARAVIAANETTIRAIDSGEDETNMAHNRGIVEARYHHDVQLKQLKAAYHEVTENELTEHEPNADSGEGSSSTSRMIDLINHSHPFYPCRVEEL